MGNCDEVPRAYPMFSQTTDASQMPWSKDRTSAGKNPSQPLNSEPVLSFFDYKKKKCMKAQMKGLKVMKV